MSSNSIKFKGCNLRREAPPPAAKFFFIIDLKILKVKCFTGKNRALVLQKGEEYGILFKGKYMKVTIEKYLMTIYALSEANESVRSIEVGHKLGVNRPDVFRAVKCLKIFGYINQKPYGKIALTEKGIKKAKQLKEIHSIITNIFIEKLSLTLHDAEANASRIEHILSDSAIEKILEYYGKDYR